MVPFPETHAGLSGTCSFLRAPTRLSLLTGAAGVSPGSTCRQRGALVRKGGSEVTGQGAFPPLAEWLCSGAASIPACSGRFLGSPGVVSPGLLAAGFGSPPAERSRRHVWLLGGGEAGEDGAGGVSRGGGRTRRAKLRKREVLGFEAAGKSPPVCFPAGGVAWTGTPGVRPALRRSQPERSHARGRLSPVQSPRGYTPCVLFSSR